MGGGAVVFRAICGENRLYSRVEVRGEIANAFRGGSNFLMFFKFSAFSVMRLARYSLHGRNSPLLYSSG